MAAQPQRWDYQQAGVPSALTKDMEAHQDARAAEKKAKQRVRPLMRTLRRPNMRDALWHWNTCIVG